MNKAYNGAVELGVRLRKQRKSLPDSRQVVAAKFLGVTQATLSRWEDGVRTPKPQDIPKIAEFLGLSGEEVMRLLYLGESEETTERLGALERGFAEIRALLKQAGILKDEPKEQ